MSVSYAFSNCVWPFVIVWSGKLAFPWERYLFSRNLCFVLFSLLDQTGLGPYVFSIYAFFFLICAFLITEIFNRDIHPVKGLLKLGSALVVVHGVILSVVICEVSSQSRLVELRFLKMLKSDRKSI